MIDIDYVILDPKGKVLANQINSILVKLIEKNGSGPSPLIEGENKSFPEPHPHPG